MQTLRDLKPGDTVGIYRTTGSGYTVVRDHDATVETVGRKRLTVTEYGRRMFYDLESGYTGGIGGNRALTEDMAAHVNRAHELTIRLRTAYGVTISHGTLHRETDALQAILDVIDAGVEDVPPVRSRAELRAAYDQAEAGPGSAALAWALGISDDVTWAGNR